jgi:membrane-anchored protein YejM (alkaline phosphatase superfamily)
LWLLNSYRVAAGFDEETTLDGNNKDRSKHVHSGRLLPAVEQRLRQGIAGPNFVVFHLMDCHAPYDSGSVKTGPMKGRYLSELERLDAELLAFRDVLAAQPFGQRVTWIVSADHGEAFGEHNTQQHATSVYDEQIRVPLWIKVPGVAPRTVSEPVGLVDLGPTVLDLFGAATPGSFMGQSLVPLLRGEPVTLTRPIAAEARLRQTLVFADGMKAIRDLTNGGRELYDLKADPGERNNLIDQGDKKYQALLDLFFDTHQNPRYERTAPWRQ